MDITELIDELSEKLVGHRNWEFASPVKTICSLGRMVASNTAFQRESKVL
jgi:hypothetical protein